MLSASPFISPTPAFTDFKINLYKFRQLASVKSICMHGSPRSKWDSKDLWKKYDYKTLDIIGEPYIDLDYSKVLYLTDTGRRRDGYKVSVRDKITSHQKQWQNEGLMFHTTTDIIKSIDKLPKKIMFTFHPQRWHESKILWIREYIVQNTKNIIKKHLINKK